MEHDNNVYSSSVDWDLHTFGVFNADMPLVLDSSSFLSSDSSPTGYLQDAITEWNNRCKRRRVLPYPQDHRTSNDQDNILQNLWNVNCQEEPFANCGALSSSDDSPNSSFSSVGICNGPSSSTETKEGEEALPYDTSATTYKTLAFEVPRVKQSTHSVDRPSSDKESARGLRRKVAYPFELVKPGGDEGVVTLDDINARILRRPTRPIRHPIGEFACLPCVHSAEGPGLSGKAVVALTRIQTQGRGTITIIRTSG